MTGDTLTIAPGALERLVSLLPVIDATADGEAISAFCALRDGLQSALDGDAPDAVERAVRYQTD
jgi:hypothetical protein